MGVELEGSEERRPVGVRPRREEVGRARCTGSRTRPEVAQPAVEVVEVEDQDDS